MDFMSDNLFSGKSFRTFNVIDDYHREALAIEVDSSLPAQQVIRVLDRSLSHMHLRFGLSNMASS
jgi:putative transposase